MHKENDRSDFKGRYTSLNRKLEQSAIRHPWKVVDTVVRTIWILLHRIVGQARRAYRVGMDVASVLGRCIHGTRRLLGFGRSRTDQRSYFSYVFSDPKLENQQEKRAKLPNPPKGQNWGRGRTAFIITYTGVSHEPRVLRQAWALRDAGWAIVVFGYQGNSENPEEWLFVELPRDNPYIGFVRRAMVHLNRWLGFMAAAFPPAGIAAHRCNLTFRHHEDEVLRIGTEVAQKWGCDLILPHDYFTCMGALRLAEVTGGKVCLDAHEYAVGQYMHNKHWKRYERPIVKALQSKCYPKLDGLTTVSGGICDLLNEDYQLKRPCVCIRSIPERVDCKGRPTGDTVTVLYHGNIDYVRGLHKAIKSMVYWEDHFRLVLRGYADASYLGYLRELVDELALGDRVEFAEPVPFADLIKKASEADIGYFVHKDLSPQKRFVLPNKFFEYIQAGLALCVSNLPSMAEIVDEYDLGVLVDDYYEKSIAKAINSMTRERIDLYKEAATRAREVLCWEVEGAKLTAYYEEVMDSE